MKGFLIFLVTLTVVSVSVGQQRTSGVECLDETGKFELFNRQIKYKATPIPITDSDGFISDTIYLKVDLSLEVKYDYLIKGIRILVINNTGNDLIFSDDGVITLFCQIKNEKGNWVDLEWRREPWNCYGATMTLGKKSYFEAVAPCYKGTKEGTLRYRFVVRNKIYYSNEFLGQVNPWQLTIGQ